MKVGIIGVGTVGASVANILRDNKDIITARAGVELEPAIGVVSNLNKDRDVTVELTDDIEKVFQNSTGATYSPCSCHGYYSRFI